MTIQLLSVFDTNIGPALANHLWQSTAFAALVALLMPLLRRNRAQVRYRLWLAVSIKFLVPFSLLVGLGGLLPKAGTITPQVAMYSVFDVAGQPFSEASLPVLPAWVERTMAQLPMILAAIWICGVATVLLVWLARWRQVSATRRRATVASSGREVTLLRRLEKRLGLHQRITVLHSSELMEPGIVGILRPAMLWPLQLSERLEDEHIEAILAHEIMHVRRRDNLTALLHMVVEALFWFHPMVWWIEKQMVKEREHACDEAVVELGCKRGTYAEGLLTACRFCVESSLVCVAGISGGELRKRIVGIMSARVAHRVAFGSRALLAVAAITVIAAPIVFGQIDAGLRASLPAMRPPAPPPPPPPPPGFFKMLAK
jgi:beta-lactamase regulating signal transducer with metallopeptidase domain